MARKKKTIPVLPEILDFDKPVPTLIVSNTVVYPYTLSPLIVEGIEDVEAVELACRTDRLLAIYVEAPTRLEDKIRETMSNFISDDDDFFVTPTHSRAIAHGTLVRVIKTLKLPDGNLRILVRGLNRIVYLANESKSEKSVYLTLYGKRDLHHLPTEQELALNNTVCQAFSDLVEASPFYPDDLKIAAMNMENPERTADTIADAMNIPLYEKMMVLMYATIEDRFKVLLRAITRELTIAGLSSDIQKQVHESINKTNREHYLREQLEVIRRELGETSTNPDAAEFMTRRQGVKLSQQASDVFDKEISRLEMLHPSSPEYHLCVTYIDWILSLPWGIYTDDHLNTLEAKNILDQDHYGLDEVKDRILEFLSVMEIRKENFRSPILCFVGPPGVGKTSLGQSIAKSINRKFVRVSLGGVRDESDIRGHRRTYIGALPGRIISGLKRAGSSNPVFMLDEIDKLCSDFRGDPAAALLEVLDPAQNVAFSDHFLDIDYDLSSVFFIATANTLDSIPEPLRDRMELIFLSGYTLPEKLQIAKRYLVPRQLTDNGIDAKQLEFTDAALNEIIRFYTSEAGVRSLERTIGKVCRKFVREQLEANQKMPFKKCKLTVKHIGKYLGAQIYLHDEGKRPSEIGVATGMAWTAHGGCILPVECSLTPGKGEIKLTGSLGDVMKESAITALTYIKANAKKLGIDAKRFTENDIHIHVPDGATPKDGPSAGITIASVLYSVFAEKAVSARYAMTGEINLRGKVTAIGGLKEKSIAALRSGITEFIVPKQNQKDLEKIPADILKEMHFHFVEEIGQVFHLLFEKTPKKQIKTKPKK